MTATLISGRAIELTVQAGTTVSELRTQIGAALTLPPGSVTLLWNEQSITDNSKLSMPLESMGITSGSHFEVVLINCTWPVLPHESFRLELTKRSDHLFVQRIYVDCNLTGKEVTIRKQYFDGDKEVMTIDTSAGTVEGYYYDDAYGDVEDEFTLRIGPIDIMRMINLYIGNASPVMDYAARLWKTTSFHQDTSLTSSEDSLAVASSLKNTWLAPVDGCTEFILEQPVPGWPNRGPFLDVVRILVDSKGQLLRVALQESQGCFEYDVSVS